jgi:hypothetical protein
MAVHGEPGCGPSRMRRIVSRSSLSATVSRM